VNWNLGFGMHNLYIKWLTNCGTLSCVEANDRLSGESLRSARNRRSSNVSQEGYGTSAVLPERGIYLTSAVYRPILQV